MANAKNLIDNKEKYDNRFERKIQNEADNNFDLDKLNDIIGKMDEYTLIEPEEYPDYMCEMNKELFEKLQSNWQDFKYSFEWLSENGYIEPYKYSLLMDDVDSIDDAFDYDNYFDITGTVTHNLEFLMDNMEDLEIERDFEQRLENIDQLEEKKKERESEKERYELMMERMKQKKEGGSRKDVDVNSHMRKTKRGKPIRVKNYRRSKPTKGR